MSGKKKVLMALLILLLISAVAGGLVWHMSHYVMVDFRFYPRDVRVLELRGQEISVGHYRKLSHILPGCEIRWDVPLSGGSFPEDSREITVTVLTDSDVEVLDYLTELEMVRAQDCRDYPQLLALQTRRPEVTVHYSVPLGEETYHCGASRIEVKNMTAEQIELLACLPRLETVICSGGDTDIVEQLQDYCHENGLAFGVNVGGTAVADTVRALTADFVTEEELPLLQFLTALEKLHLVEPAAPAEALVQLKNSCPNVAVSWEMEAFGTVLSTEDTEIDFSEAEIGSIEQVKDIMAYFPDADKVFLGLCGLDNEALAAYREEVREDYRVVWTVQCGKKMTARTDDTTFMPTREHVYYFNDEEAYNLRYCEDMVCIDIGHMSISDISFVSYMPNLEYLILAHTQVQYIEPIRSCKRLKFLELDWSPIKDYSPLVECTALEDLNLGNTYADFTPIGTMTWLKNLWMIGCSTGAKYRMTQALPDTKVMVSGSATVANGWRDLENYYAMRDLLGMYYMSW